jgi:hypothetical protein
MDTLITAVNVSGIVYQCSCPIVCRALNASMTLMKTISGRTWKTTILDLIPILVDFGGKTKFGCH